MNNACEKPLKLAGIAFFVLVFFINPFVAEVLQKQYFALSVVLVLIGLAFYVPSKGVRKGALALLTVMESRQCWWVLAAQVVLFFVFMFSNQGAYLNYSLHANWGDQPSYVDFNFSTWTTVLGNHRTVGFPVIIKAYQQFFPDFNAWPYFQMMCYVMSVVFLFWSFLKYGMNRVLAFIFVTLLLWDKGTYKQFLDVQTEVMTAVFLNLAVGCMFLAMKKWHWKTVVPLTLSVFWLYQVRPHFSVVALMVPFWAAAAVLIAEGPRWKRAIWTGGRFALCAILPLMVFGLLRLAVVGHFGVVSSGGYLSGHATHYLHEQNITRLSGDVRRLADEILLRKRQLKAPNNLSPFDWVQVVTHPKKIEMEAMAFGPNLITAWSVAIKQLKGVEPFADPRHNLEPMEYSLPLSDFHAKYYDYKVDQLLHRFSTQVLAMEKERYSRWLVGGSFYGMRLYFSQRSWLVWLGLLALAKMFFMVFARNLDQVRLKQWNTQAGILAFIGSSIFIVCYIPVIVFNFPFPRLLELISIYLLPALVCAAFPPFWLKADSGQEGA